MKEILIGILSGLLLVMIVDAANRPKVDLPEEVEQMQKGDQLKCDSVINGKIYLSYENYKRTKV